MGGHWLAGGLAADGLAGGRRVGGAAMGRKLISQQSIVLAIIFWRQIVCTFLLLLIVYFLV
jgi:hypothetical protein